METKAGTNPVMLQLAGKKLRSKLSSRLNESASMGVSTFARRQLEAMGWTEGTGLGKRRTGMKTHITVQKRDDEQGGLGKKSDAAALHGTHDWWKDSLEATLSKLSSGDDKKKKKKKSKKSKKDKKESGKKRKKTSYTDEELFEATGGARFGMRAQAPQRGKWQRAEKDVGGDKDGNDDESTPKAEWDGLSDPKVLLSSSSSTATPPAKKKRKLDDNNDDDDKKEEETHEVSDKEEDTEEQPKVDKKVKKDKSKKKKDKKSKKEKRKRKEKKKSKEQEKSHEVTSSSSESEDDK